MIAKFDITSCFSEVTSFIGTEIGDPTSSLAEVPPRSAKLVATISWNWSPMHSRCSEYRIATDKKRESWHLYELYWIDNVQASARVASGTPYKGVTDTQAARVLLKSAWASEIEQWDFDPSGFEIYRSGLLTEDDVEGVALYIAWERSTDWFQSQSAKSLHALKEQLPKLMDEQSIEVADELESCAEVLGLSQDFFELCEYFQVAPPNLLVLTSKLIESATIRRERQKQKRQLNLVRLENKIAILVSELNTYQGRGGGILIPSTQDRVKNYLEQYVGERGELPAGEHLIRGLSDIKFDFDALRAKYKF
jgi:hypothetical protein